MFYGTNSQPFYLPVPVQNCNEPFIDWRLKLQIWNASGLLDLSASWWVRHCVSKTGQKCSLWPRFPSWLGDSHFNWHGQRRRKFRRHLFDPPRQLTLMIVGKYDTAARGNWRRLVVVDEQRSMSLWSGSCQYCGRAVPWKWVITTICPQPTSHTFHRSPPLRWGGFKSGSSLSAAFFLLCVKGAPAPQGGCLITPPSRSLQLCVHQDAAPQIVTHHTHLTIGNIHCTHHHCCTFRAKNPYHG